MLVGDPCSFAIESGIKKAYERSGFLALGFFVIHIGGQRYGVYAPDATLIGCSLDEVHDRIACRGGHTAPFASEPDAGRIADAYRDSVFAPDQENKFFFGIPEREIRDLLYSNRLVWAPDGDEAFDDGSHVLHLDVGNRVRLIGFRSIAGGYHHDPATLAEVWLDAGEFYRTLQQWLNMFEAAWQAVPKIPESADGIVRH